MTKETVSSRQMVSKTCVLSPSIFVAFYKKGTDLKIGYIKVNARRNLSYKRGTKQ